MSSPFFSDTLKSLIGYSVGVFSSDGTLMKGTMVDVKKDHLILQNTEETYTYYYLTQIKSVSKNAKQVQANTIGQDYLQAEQLQEILEQCKDNWVTLNCYNAQFVTGFLSRVFNDHLILINGEEQIIIQNAFIMNVQINVQEITNKEAFKDKEKSELERKKKNQLEKIKEVQNPVKLDIESNEKTAAVEKAAATVSVVPKDEEFTKQYEKEKEHIPLDQVQKRKAKEMMNESEEASKYKEESELERRKTDQMETMKEAKNPAKPQIDVESYEKTWAVEKEKTAFSAVFIMKKN